MKYSEEIKVNELSIALTASLLEEILAKFDAGQALATALYYPSMGKTRFTCLVHHLTSPDEICKNEKAGLVLIGVKDAIDAFLSENTHLSAEAALPIALLYLDDPSVLAADMLSVLNETRAVETVRVIGKKLRVHYREADRAKPEFQEIYKRTVTVWGKENHDNLARLRVGVIGLGSVGSLVAEALARMGLERFVLVDFDEVQIHNLDRLLGASRQDIGVAKVEVAERQIKLAATATTVNVSTVIGGVTEKAGYESALDCDLLFSCVDRPWPRYVLNHLAYNHLIPVVDGGIQVRLEPGSLVFEGADWQLQSVGPERPCLECLGAYQPSHVTMEKDGKLEDPTYLAGLPETHEFKRNENIFPFSMNLASLEIMQFIEQVTGIAYTDYYGVQRFSYNEGYIRVNDTRTCEPGCYFQEGIAQGDAFLPPPIGNDLTAEQARERQN
jgi:molybdopterin/thiamine biosynthesis adenylyltransferase